MKITSLVGIALLTLCGWVSAHAAESAESKIVHEFFESWHSGDIDKVMSYLAPDVYYANHPSLRTLVKIISTFGCF